MRHGFLLAGPLLLFCCFNTGATNSKDLSRTIKIVNPDFEILSAKEKKRESIRPLMWRCFPIKDVEVKYRTWPFTDPTEPTSVIEIMCDFEIWVNSKPFQNVYHGRRGKPESYCKDFQAAWIKLTKGEEHICIDGETLTKGEPQEDEKTKKIEASWTWDKIKTKKGCYSYWNGNICNDF